MDRNKGTHLQKSIKRSFEECNSTWSYPILLIELMVGKISEYVIIRRHINTRKYLYISYYEKLCFSLMYLFCCAKYFMMDDMYNCLADLMTRTKITVACMKQSIRDSCNIFKSPISLGTYNKMCQVFISSNKPEHIFSH